MVREGGWKVQKKARQKKALFWAGPTHFVSLVRFLGQPTWGKARPAKNEKKTRVFKAKREISGEGSEAQPQPEIEFPVQKTAQNIKRGEWR